jgi:hypothetical protein
MPRVEEKSLLRVLQPLGATEARLSPPRIHNLKAAGVLENVRALFADLDGVADAFAVNPGPWDIQYGDMLIELDEHQHFNRYRATTLRSSAYEKTTFSIADYSRYCERHEDNCLRKARSGGYWENDSTRRMFGGSSPPGKLEAPGPSRWKQRAFYDFVKDLSVIEAGGVVSRVSIWDPISIDGKADYLGATLVRIAGQPKVGDAERHAIEALVRERSFSRR